ncbi:NRDE-2, necessary for RNA interference-domain-containing protein [Parachaetomium inaequale]|uniref:NRDE-2, necessary for RNA interference-domain-containing protein n=1 Tax=Parachaetomium inaequale TaxID=2588326 RepID=A0AAN6SPP6_9PEZI|nr:NRDE-2, necessary for RNA interference-domain-containing protein [Parachaetomium inaequale]
MEQDKERRRAVPKFGSFRPKPTPESGPETRPALDEARVHRDGLGGAEKDERRRHERDRDRDRRREGDRRGSGREREGQRDRDREGTRTRDREGTRGREGARDRERERERDYERGREGKRERQHGRHERPPRPSSPRTISTRNKIDREDSSAQNNDLFVLDKRGDPLILQYGTNDRSQVPVYYRFGAGRIIGSPGFLTIHREGAQEEFSIRAPGGGSGSGSAFRDKALVAAAARLNSKRIKPSADQPLPTASEDFIPLSPSRKRKRDHDDPPPPNYRSIYGSSKNRPSPSPSPSPSRSPSRSPSPEPEPSPTKSRATHLSHHVKSHPTDIPAWLELIALQDTLFFQAQSDPTRPRTADETRSLAELKLSLYQEALAHATSPGDREGLVLGMMRRVWEEGVLERKWKEVVSSDAGFGLWRGGLDFEMGRVVGFGFEGVKGEIVGKLRGLREEIGRVVAGAGREGEEEKVAVCGQVVYVFLRLTRFLADAGFAELAVAAWQGVLEMTFCRPPRDGYTAEAALASFADFWESEVARIGEEGAKGWRHFVEAGEDMADPPEPKADRSSEVPKTTDPFKAWAAVEHQGAEKARMPARTLDEGAEDDPFRVVMFSDIKDLLVWFPSAVLPLVRPLLADAYLVFCGLPPAGLSGEKFASMLDDPFVARRGQGLDLGLSRDDGTTQDLTSQAPEFKQMGGNMAISPEVLFSGTPRFRYLDKWSDTHLPGNTQVDISWVLRTLGYLVKDCRMEALAEYYLAMEWLNEPAGARKVAKGLLKQYSSSIGLYNAYALVEWANGNVEVSHKVLSSATGLVLPSSSGNQLLWNTWAWIHLESNQKELALVRLCSSADGEFQGSPSPALLLKTRSHFSATRDYSISSQQLETAAHYAESLMLLEYISAEGGSEPASETQGNITAALSTIHAFSQELSSRNLHTSPHHERLLQTAARLLYHHATHGPYRPIYLRAQLEPLTRLFPHNTLFLALAAWCQPPLRIDDPIRATLQSLSGHSLGTRRFAIYHEARVGTAHSVRAAFEAALAGEEGAGSQGSVELWVRYVRFCCENKELRGRAKEVFYRAVGACPWAKEVYMEGFGVPGLSAAELRAVGETVAAKGLRVHVDLEEFLGARGRERGG